MPLLDVQRRIARTGAIRLGNQVPIGGTYANGKPKTRPNKLDSFRITSPHRSVMDAVAALFGGIVTPWAGASGPEFEVITTVRELPVLVPQQVIDPNYELWGNKYKDRCCDGKTERLRGIPCLCAQWDNHQHKYWKGSCSICGISENWGGAPHEHHFEFGSCVVCGSRRPCKPTTRVSVMIRGVPSAGVFKVESHGINAAMDLPGFADIIAQAPVPLPARLAMEFVDQLRLVPDPRGDRTEARKFWVPRLLFDWLTPDMAYAGSGQLETAARAQLAVSSTPTELPALGAAPAASEPDEKRLTAADVMALAGKCVNIPQVQQLWKDAAHAGVLTTEVSAALTATANALKDAAAKPDAEREVVDAEIVDDPMWPEVAQPGRGRRAEGEAA